MIYPEGMSTVEREQLSRGFDAGNYGNAYESQDWPAWFKKRQIRQLSPAYQDGALLGFFSSYALDEIFDEELRERVRVLRARHDYEACATCGATLSDDYLSSTRYDERVRDCGGHR